MRIFKFMQKTLLRKRQRQVVQFFMQYMIEDLEIKEKQNAGEKHTANELIENFDPVNN